MWMHLSTQQNRFPWVHKVFPELSKWVKVQGSGNQLEQARCMPFPSQTLYTPPPLIYISMHSFIFGEALQATGVDIWNSKKLINIQRKKQFPEVILHRLREGRKPTCMSVSGRVIIWQRGPRGSCIHNLYQLISLISSFSLGWRRNQSLLCLVGEEIIRLSTLLPVLAPYWRNSDIKSLCTCAVFLYTLTSKIWIFTTFWFRSQVVK